MSRSMEHLKEYEADFKAKGREFSVCCADASDFGGFAEAFKGIVKEYGTPDVLFYNAGITEPDGDIDAYTLIERYAVDAAGAYNVIKLADSPEFAAKEGAILITNGIFAVMPNAGYLPLSMDKAALRAMVLALSPVYREKGIFIGSVRIMGVIGSNEHLKPENIAKEFWRLYQERGKAEVEY